MTDSSREESIFNAALELSDAAARAEYISNSCESDPALRERVERLLSAYDEGDFLESPVARLAPTAWQEPVGEKSGDTIGPYKLLEQIGEGGMGLVFMAEQSLPLRRRVALKIIKPGLDTRAVIARFEAERQALALMDHPNIARVYDAGATDSGRPYFAMELVRGVPITDYCCERALTLHERLKLFIEICQAVQHAHQKGVIHRDLKPTNILVSQSDTAPVPKVIDFGVAKATSSQILTDKTLFTAFTQIIGTPLYMSPEQADLGNQDVDTRSDVYSLGVVLYELLTGTTPFDAERLQSAGADEMRRIIREEEPPKPSTRATTLAAALSTVEAKPSTPSRIDVSALKGDLDWIVMKALDKDRRRRYESPSALAADIARYLNHEPVEAFPPTRRYRLLKYARRNRWTLLTTGAIAAALLMGIGASLWQAVRATNAERAKDAALSQARRAVDDMYTKVAEEWLANQGELSDVQRELLESALSFYEGMSASDDASFDVQLQTLQALQRVGAIRSRLGMREQAKLDLRKATARSEGLRRQYPDRVELIVESLLARTFLIEIERSLGRKEQVTKQLHLAIADLGRLDLDGLLDASVRERAATGLGLLMTELTLAGHANAGEKAIRAAMLLWHQLVDKAPDNFKYRRGLACSYADLGTRQMWWGSTDGQAEATLRKADKLLSELLLERPGEVKCRGSLTVALGNLGMILGWQGRLAEALEVERRNISITESLARDFPNEPRRQNGLAIALGNLAGRLDEMGSGELGESDQLRRRWLATREALVDQYPDEAEYAIKYVETIYKTILFLRDQDRIAEADEVAGAAFPHVARIAIRHADNTAVADTINIYLTLQAARLLEQDDYRAAAECMGTCSPAGREFHADLTLPDHAPQQHLALQQESYFSQVYVLGSAAELLAVCVDLARADSDMPDQERTAFVAKQELLAEQFRQATDKAINAWQQIVLPQGESGIAFASWGEYLAKEWTEDSAGNDWNPQFLTEAYARVSRLFFRRLVHEGAARRSDDHDQIWISLLLTTAPEPLRDIELALTMARRGMELSQPDDACAQHALGCALYRAGHWQESAEILTAIPSDELDGPPSVLVMALWKLGRIDEARATFENSAERLEEYDQFVEKREAKNNVVIMPSRAMIKRLYDEATALLTPDEPSPDEDK